MQNKKTNKTKSVPYNWQITMWSGTEMRGVGRVILACFTAAMRREQDPGRLSAAAQSDLKLAIRASRPLTDFSLIV